MIYDGLDYFFKVLKERDTLRDEVGPLRDQHEILLKALKNVCFWYPHEEALSIAQKALKEIGE